MTPQRAALLAGGVVLALELVGGSSSFLLRALLVALCALLAALFAMSQTDRKRDLAAAPLPPPLAEGDLSLPYPGPRRVRLSHGWTSFEIRGPPTGELVLLVHGFQVPPRWLFSKAMRDFPTDGFRVLAFDLYGRGDSDAPRVIYDDQLFVSQAIELLYKLDLGGAKFHLLGYSMGGAIAARLAQLYPERVRTLTFGAPAGLRVNTPAVGRFVAATPVLGDVLFWLLYPIVGPKGVFRDFKDNTTEIAREIITTIHECYRVSTANTPGFTRAVCSSLRYFPLQSMHSAFEELGAHKEIPVLVLWGDFDGLVPFSSLKLLQQLVPHARAEVFPGLGHNFMLESWPRFRELVRDHWTAKKAQ